MSLGEGEANRFQWLLFLQILHGFNSPFWRSGDGFLKDLRLISNSSSSSEVGLKTTP